MTWMKEPEFFSKKVMANGYPYRLHPTYSTRTKRIVYHCELWSVVITAVVTPTSTTVSIIQYKDDGSTVGLIVTPDRVIKTIELLLGSKEEELKDNTETRYPPPEAFNITHVRREELLLTETSTGFFLYHSPTAQTRWLSDGVDMFFGDDHGAISPGTMEWWFAAYEWLSDETELMEAYFPEVTHDNM